MNTFHETFKRVSYEHLLVKLVSQKAEEQRYSLTHAQLATIREQISKADGDTFTIELPADEDFNLQISITDEDFTHIIDEYAEKLSDAMPRIVQETAEVLLAELKSTAPEMLAEHKQVRSQFEESVFLEWNEALDLMEMLIVIASEAGEDFTQEFGLSVSQDNDFRFEVLTRLHARSCQIANEILTLLKAGYADGAHARWRTMHEITVIGFFINGFGQDVAERYLLHEAVESYVAARQYQRYSNRLGYESLTDRELSDLESSYQHLIDRFGRPYAKPYGWAAQALSNNNPNFSDIEQTVDLAYWRSHYKLASHNVHANPKGVFFKLGLYPEERELLLAGPSDTGFADPGHSTAISLLQITTILLTLHPNIDRLSVCQIMSTLAEEIGDTFLSIQRGIEGNS
jgi:hypothetical protein